MNRRQLLIILSLIIVVPIGFWTKFYNGPAQSWVNDSLGGLFYEIFWCLLLGLIFTNSRPVKIAVSVLVITSILEVAQLWHPPFLEMLRGNFIGRTILGNSFNWHDFPYYLIGSSIGYLWLLGIQKLSIAEEH